MHANQHSVSDQPHRKNDFDIRDFTFWNASFLFIAELPPTVLATAASPSAAVSASTAATAPPVSTAAAPCGSAIPEACAAPGRAAFEPKSPTAAEASCGDRNTQGIQAAAPSEQLLERLRRPCGRAKGTQLYNSKPRTRPDACAIFITSSSSLAWSATSGSSG